MDNIIAAIVGAWAFTSLVKELVDAKAPQETEDQDIVWNEAITERLRAAGC